MRVGGRRVETDCDPAALYRYSTTSWVSTAIIRAEDAKQLHLLLLGEVGPHRGPGRGRPARGGWGWGRGMVRVLRRVRPAVDRTSGPVPATATGPRRQVVLYPPELHPRRGGVYWDCLCLCAS